MKKDKCFTKVPNKLLETITKTKLSNTESAVLLVIIRQTFGWQKESDRIAMSQFAKKIKSYKANVNRAVKNLRKRKIIFRDNHFRYKINPNYEEWALVRQLTLVRKHKFVSQITSENVSQATKYKRNKKINKRKELFFDGEKCIIENNEIFVISEGILKEWSGFNSERFVLIQNNQKLIEGKEALNYFKKFNY